MRDEGQGSAPIGLQFPASFGERERGEIWDVHQSTGSSLGCTKQTLAGWIKLLGLGNAPQNPSGLLLGWLEVLRVV